MRLPRFAVLTLVQVVLDLLLAPSSCYALASKARRRINPQVISLQDPHPRESPARVFRRLADVCDEQGIDTWDVYGDFDLNKEESFLRRFEGQVAADLGKEDAIFMPSGVMAQAIALKIHQATKRTSTGASAEYFICHETSHLLLHEQQAYDKLVHMKPIVVSTKPTKAVAKSETNDEHDNQIHQVDDDSQGHQDENDQTETSIDSDNQQTTFPHIPPMGFADFLQTLTNLQWSETMLTQNVAALMVELPHRELGGKITPYADLQRLAEYCVSRKIALHCDGARLFEAMAAYNDPDKGSSSLSSPADLCTLFDSVYISFYKGLGGMSGAMLCGTKSFCQEARVWLRRFGGNLYTLLPYAVSAYEGYLGNYKFLLPPVANEETTTAAAAAAAAAAPINGSSEGSESALDEQQLAQEQDDSSSSSSSSSSNDNFEQDPANDDDMMSTRKRASGRLSFTQQRDKLREIVFALSSHPEESMIPRLVTFDPPVPETNMVHGYLKCTAEEGMEWCGWITQETGVQVLRRIKPLTDESSLAWQSGYRSMFEWSVGNANGQIPVDVFVEGWTALAETYVANHVALENGEQPIAYSDDDDDDDDDDANEDEKDGNEKENCQDYDGEEDSAIAQELKQQSEDVTNVLDDKPVAHE